MAFTQHARIAGLTFLPNFRQCYTWSFWRLWVRTLYIVLKFAVLYTFTATVIVIHSCIWLRSPNWRFVVLSRCLISAGCMRCCSICKSHANRCNDGCSPAPRYYGMIYRTVDWTGEGRDDRTGPQMACVTVDRAYRALMNAQRSFADSARRVLLIFSRRVGAGVAACWSVSITHDLVRGRCCCCCCC